MFSTDRNGAFMASDRAASADSGSATRQDTPQEYKLITQIPRILPHERVFPIQIGSKLFKLSGASLSSDAPSYFSQYFQCQIRTAEQSGEDLSSSIRTLYIDRDPVTFQDIALHLQGYHIQPRDGTHFVRLFADAQFYSLPRLISQLYEESIFMSIGHKEFQIPRDLFKDPGNSPNFFTLGFAIFFSTPGDLFPGLDRSDLIRPPSIMPPCVPHRSAETFEEILHLLRGNPVIIRNEAHRQTLLRDVRYFNFKGLEQRLIAHSISYNQLRARHEILLRLEDIYKSGIVATVDHPGAAVAAAAPAYGWVNYARPYLSDPPAELVLQVGGETTRMAPPVVVPSADLVPASSLAHMTQLEFFLDSKRRISRLMDVVAAKLGAVAIHSDRVRAVVDQHTAITLDGKPYLRHRDGGGGGGDNHKQQHDHHDSADVGGDSFDDVHELAAMRIAGPSRKRRKTATEDPRLRPAFDKTDWIIRTGQWRIRTRSMHGRAECVLFAVKLDAISNEHSRNITTGFLP